MDLLAMLPWWVCVVLAAGSYVLLHRWAGPLQPADMVAPSGALITNTVQKAVVHALATAGQYLVPLLCLVAAVLSVLRRKKRKALLDNVAQAPHANALDGVTWREFELLVGEAYRVQGYRIAELGGRGPDGGVDLVLTKGAEKTFVQCKQWKAHRVGVAVVRELYGVMAAEGAAAGIVVTSGRYTQDATAFASGRNIQLVDGPQLFAMIQAVRKAQAARKAPSAVAPVQAQVPAPLPPVPAKGPVAAPTSSVPGEAAAPCPRCGAPMVLRVARQGANAGQSFWGCSTYPKCRGIRAAT